jgi:hypothetical protein
MKKAILIDMRLEAKTGAVIIKYVNLPENPTKRRKQTLSLLKANHLELIDSIGDDGDFVQAGLIMREGVLDNGIPWGSCKVTGMYLISNDNGDVKNSAAQIADYLNLSETPHAVGS